MTLSTDQVVRETYRTALEENLRKSLRTQDEFDRFTEINQEAAGRVDAEKDAFRVNYHQRVANATEVILREHTAQTLDHPKPDWAVETPPSADKTNLLARNRVQANHDARIAAICVDQAHQFQALREACHARERAALPSQDQNKRQLRDGFNLTNQTSRHERGLPLRSGPSHS